MLLLPVRDLLLPVLFYWIRVKIVRGSGVEKPVKGVYLALYKVFTSSGFFNFRPKPEIFGRGINIRQIGEGCSWGIWKRMRGCDPTSLKLRRTRANLRVPMLSLVDRDFRPALARRGALQPENW